MPPIHTLTLDLHVHTNYSHDGHDSVAKIIESAIAQMLDGIAICDHDTMDGSYAAREYVANHNLDLIIIPGIEVTTSKGHLLVLGLEEKIEKGLSPAETIRIARERAKELNSIIVIIVPHPFHPFRHSIGNVHQGIDAIEIFNSRYFTGVGNKIASIKAARNNITAVAGSDAHSAECVGLATVVVETEPDQEAILGAIKKGKVQIKNCKRTPFWVYFKHFVLKCR
ncbi:MAG TPA: PHP domain-containing protein [Methanophagales archaeon]|nr:PHP domain-containing protein [Methanophagales archaeon]